MHRRGERTGGRWTLVGLVAAVGLLAGCTAAPAPRPTPSSPPAVRWTPAEDADRPVVLDGATAVQRAIEASRAFFASSPGVIVARDRDASGQRAAAATARRVHAPVLLLPAAPATPPSKPASTASPSASTDAGPAMLAAEVRRLGARWIAGADVRPPRIAGVRVTALAAARASAARPAPATTVVAGRAAADTASLATAAAAGAAAVDLGGAGDLLADGKAVSALAAAKQDRVVLLGSAFAHAGDPSWELAAARTGRQYPGGGEHAFDDRLFVALYGAPGAPALGVLGHQGAAAAVDRARSQAKAYDPLVHDPVVPMMEIIATVASGSPTDDGDYSSELPMSTLTTWVDAAQKAGMPVVLDLQPGRADFLSQAKRLAPLLERPGVGLALDPEWRLGPTQKPLVQIGRVSADEVNRTSAWLADLVRDHGLPPKMFVLHQFRLTMLQDRSRIVVDRPELDTLIHVDGQGGQPDKQATWRAVRAGAPDVAWGWKNFLVKDHPVLTPAQTIQQVHPTPDLITYQ